MLELRPARLDDADALVLVEEVQRYYVEIYGGRDDDPLDPDEFAPPSGRFLLGVEEGRPIAMGGWSRDHGAPLDAKIRRMYVRPEGRRRGSAARLLDALEDDARAAGATRAVLTTGEPQREAVRFYRSRGYTDIAPFGFYAGSPGSVHLGKAL